MIKIIAAKVGDENEHRVNTGVRAAVRHARNAEDISSEADTASLEERPLKQALGRFGSDSIRTDHALDAGANRAQQERRQMRVIGGLRFDLALGAARLRTADRGHARGGRSGRWLERLSRGLRLRTGIATALGMARLALTLARLTLARFALTVAWLTLTARLAAPA
jgi:hypothetical protein